MFEWFYHCFQKYLSISWQKYQYSIKPNAMAVTLRPTDASHYYHFWYDIIEDQTGFSVKVDAKTNTHSVAIMINWSESTMFVIC